MNEAAFDTSGPLGFSDVDGVREYSDEVAVVAAFDLIRQLRPQLTDLGQWLAAFKRQALTGYRIMMLIADNKPLALAGFRIQENLIHGRFLYVDDLITDSTTRSAGLGRQMIAALLDEAGRSDCIRLVLDTAIANHDAQRFYKRCGMNQLATRFVTMVGQADESK